MDQGQVCQCAPVLGMLPLAQLPLEHWVSQQHLPGLPQKLYQDSAVIFWD